MVSVCACQLGILIYLIVLLDDFLGCLVFETFRLTAAKVHIIQDSVGHDKDNGTPRRPFFFGSQTHFLQRDLFGPIQGLVKMAYDV